METYDDAAFERFCSGLVNEGFSPVSNRGRSVWTGPIRPSLRELTDATRMRIHFYTGWPFRYAHVVVDGLRTEHAAQGTICLWAEDDPAQIAGRDLQGLWDRVDDWAMTAKQGFRAADRALDAYLLFDEQSYYQVELPFGDLLRIGNNGYLASLVAKKQGPRALLLEVHAASDPPDEPLLKGAFYLRRDIGQPPRHLEDIRSALTRRQAQDLERGLRDRASTPIGEPSGGYDFIVLAWPRHDNEYDAVVVGFDGRGDALKAAAMSATPNDLDSRRRRAGPDAEALREKVVLLAGVGSVGGYVAVALASSGVGKIHLHDSDYLKTGNLARHVVSRYAVGYEKTFGVAIEIDDHAPWTTVTRHEDLPFDPPRLASRVQGVDLVVDCTGVFSVSAALAETCRREAISLITGALFHHGSLARVQRQTSGDTPIAARSGSPRYFSLPPGIAMEDDQGFLELGCTAPINNAPPVAVLTIAAEIAGSSIDVLTGRLERTDERIVVLRPMGAPFDKIGTLDAT